MRASQSMQYLLECDPFYILFARSLVSIQEADGEKVQGHGKDLKD